VRDLAGQDALAAAGIGLLVRDNVAALTGVYLPSLRDRGLSAYSGRGWQDRAALMEGIWERQAPTLAGPFLADRPGSVTGPLILNSTSVGTGCRVLVSQLWFPPTRGQNAAEPYDPLCRSGAAPLPASFDLIADYGGSDGRDGSHCLGGLSVATAVMLSARFAYVTPSGVVGPCHALTEQQLIDGGYAESSGLGTVVDLAGAGRALPRGQSEADGWLAHVRQHNAQAWAELTRPSGQGTATPVFIAPVVVFLQNHFRSDLASSTSRPSNEILVPVDGKAAGAAQTATASLLQRALTLTAPDVPCAPAGGVASEVSPDCAKVRETIRAKVPYSVVVISPDTRPAVTAPLGWVLSHSSRTGLDDAMDRQKRTTCLGMTAAEPYRTSPDCQAGYGRLADLLATLTGPRS
jgi:hypothetical protein